MEQRRFDAVVRSLATPRSRRSALAATAALLGLGAVADEATAARCSKRKPCPTCHACKKRKCKAIPDGGACGGGRICTSLVCDCPVGEVNCTGTCFPAGSCCPGTTRSCYSGSPGTRNIGACKDGTQTCDIDGTWPSGGGCPGEVLPTAETCNGVDDDCDGVVDNGAC